MKLSKTEQLQALWDSRKTSYNWDFQVKWRGTAGWWGMLEEARHFGDEGEFLGMTFEEAKKTLTDWLA